MSGLHLLGSLAIIMLELKSSLSQAWCCVGLQLLAAGAAIGHTRHNHVQHRPPEPPSEGDLARGARGPFWALFF